MISKITSSLQDEAVKREPLKGEFKGLFKIRFGDYRVIYANAGEDILVLRIGHRSKVYER